MADHLPIIRAAGPGDAAQILAFIRELAEYERLAAEVTATRADIARALAGDPPAAQCLLAEADGEAVGFALFFHNFSTFTGKRGLYLEDLFVRPRWRGRGIGRRLLARLARIAVERGCARFDWAVLDWNEPAIRFYESLGARQMRDWRTTRLAGAALRGLAAEDG